MLNPLKMGNSVHSSHNGAQNKCEKMESILKYFFIHQMQLRIYHFQTKYFGAHKASDEYADKFAANLDRFMEVYQGIKDNNKLALKDSFKLKVDIPSDDNIQEIINDFISVLKNCEHFLDTQREPGLLTIRDEMVADAQQFKYLLLFK